ncbi:MAG: aldehyde dehydrogenase family protein [Candidatus Micrarchaeota archaeon]
MADQYKMFINGEWVDAQSKESFVVYDSATAEVFARVARGGTKDAKKAIDAARTSFDKGEWQTKTLAERARYIFKLADAFEQNKEYFASLEAKDVGKPIQYSLQCDFPFFIDNMRYFAGACRAMSANVAMNYDGGGINYVKKEPIGVVVAFIPWNCPLSILVLKMIPALLMGNSIIIKPSSEALVSILEFIHLTEKVKFPKGVINLVTGPGETVGRELGTSSKVDMITYSGNAETGKKIIEEASISFKKLHLELHGKSPLIVLKDAELNSVAKQAIFNAFGNSGQETTSVARVFVPKAMQERFVKMLVNEAKKLKIGDPAKYETEMGPLTSARIRDKVEGYISSGIAEGAKLAYGGKRLESGIFERGFFIKPTILKNVNSKMNIFHKDIFGPVLSVIPYTNIEQAIKEANSLQFGSGASVWGKDMQKLNHVSDKLRFGTVWINEHGSLVSEMPFGRYGKSGTGLDLSVYAFDAYSETKHVYMKS